MTLEFDYVIAGGGSAGCALAARLSEDKSVTRRNFLYITTGSFFAAGSAAGIIPLAAAKAPALTKFLKCVTGDKIVLAICDAALGYNTKLSYNLPTVPLSPLTKLKIKSLMHTKV